MGPQPPPMAPIFISQGWRDMSTQNLEKYLIEALTDDPEISDATKISVKYTEPLSGKDGEIEILGKVASEEERERAFEIVKVNTKEEINIKNNLVVGE